MRGKGRLSGRSLIARRIIPACAGKSFLDFSRRQPIQDHPRVCGEKDNVCLYVAASWGSSPRVRGKGPVLVQTPRGDRIIPACAGKSLKSIDKTLKDEDHPRVCGEKHLIRADRPRSKGSSPRVRGKERHPLKRLPHPRIIPACAGKRSSAAPISISRWDHPRVCGEKGASGDDFVEEGGSSPRVRGKADCQA